MSAPLAILTCEACGSRVMPALVKCPECGTRLHKKTIHAATSIASATPHRAASAKLSGDDSLEGMLALAAPADASTASFRVVSTPHGTSAVLSAGRETDVERCDRSVGAAQSPRPARIDTAGAVSNNVASKRPGATGDVEFSFADAAKHLPPTPLIAKLEGPTATESDSATKKTLSRSQAKKLIAALVVEDPANQDEAVARRQALQELGEAGEVSALKDVLQTIDDPWIPVREAAAAALGNLRDPAATPVLVRMMGDQSATVSRAAVTSLGQIGDARAVEALVHLSLTQPHRKGHVYEAIAAIKAAALPELIKLLKHAEPSVVLESIVVLGHLRDRLATDALTSFLTSNSTLMQGYAAEALGKIGDPKAVAPLCQAAQTTNPGVRASAVVALSLIGDKRAEKILLQCLQDRDEELRYHAVKGLGRIGDKRYLSAIVPLLADENDRVRMALAEAFGEIVDPRLIEPLVHLLQDGEEPVRVKAATSIRKYRDPRLVNFLLAGLNDESETVQLRCIDALGEQKSADAVVPLVGKLTMNRSITIRAAAAKALGEVGDESAVDHLVDALKDEYNVRCKAIVSLGQIGSSKSLPALLSLLKDPIPEIRYHAAGALSKLDNQYARLAIEKLLEDSSPMVRKCAAKVLADRGDEHAAALLKDNLILKRRPRASVKKLVTGVNFSGLADKLRHASMVAKISAGIVGLVVVGAVLGVAGFLPKSLTGAGAAPVLRGNVAHVSFAADGQHIAVARNRGLLELWKRAETSPPQQFPLSSQAISYTPHAQMLLLANGAELLTWKLDAPNEPPQSIAKFNSPIKFMMSTPDYKFAVTWTADGVARLWNLTTMREAQSLQIPVLNNLVISLSPDGRTIVSGTQQGTVIIWDASSGKQLYEIPNLNGSVTAVAYSRDGQRFAAGTKKGHYYVWDYSSGQLLADWNDAGAVKFLWVDTTNDRLLAVSGLSTMKRWNWTEGKATDFPITDAESYDMVAVTSDGQFAIVAGTNDSPVWMFDVEQGTLAQMFEVEP